MLGFLGIRITFGIKIYNNINDGLYNDLIIRAWKIEDGMGVETGIFKGRKNEKHKKKPNYHRIKYL